MRKNRVKIREIKELIKTNDYLNMVVDKMLNPGSKFLTVLAGDRARTKTIGRLNG